MNENSVPARPVLIVDDEQTAIAGLQMMLESEGIDNILTLADSREVMPLLQRTRVGVVMLDLCMPHLDGRELLDRIVMAYPDIPVVVVTGYNEVDTAIDCMKAGAFDYLVKPADEARVLASVNRAIEYGELKSEYASFRQRVLDNELENPGNFSHIVTGSQKMYNLFRYVETIAATRRTVLVKGETGTGKELLASAIHMSSGRPGPFVSVNVAGLDEQMFSDTLFGHLKGAFTGAAQHRAGLVEKAKGGTLFLDEIGDLSMGSQVKLLRLLQENEYFPLGADAPRVADARIVVATNVDLHKAQENSSFRSDLYFRLKTHQLTIPPLRDRAEDIPVLLSHFLNTSAVALGKKVPTPPKELTRVLSTYNFPGNVRELESMVFDAVTHHSSKILSMNTFKSHMDMNRGDSDISQPPGDDVGATPFSLFSHLPTLAEAREMLISEALRRSDGNQTIASQMVGISRSGLSKAISRKEK